MKDGWSISKKKGKPSLREALFVSLALIMLGCGHLFGDNASDNGIDPKDDSALPVDEPFASVIHEINAGGMIYPGLTQELRTAEGTIGTTVDPSEMLDRLEEVCRENHYRYHRYDLTKDSPIGFLNAESDQGDRSFMVFQNPADGKAILKFSIELPENSSGQQALIDHYPELNDLGEILTDQKETYAPHGETGSFLYQDSFPPGLALQNADNILERAGWQHLFGKNLAVAKLGGIPNLFYKDNFVLWLHGKREASGNTFMICQVMQQGEKDQALGFGGEPTPKPKQAPLTEPGGIGVRP